MKKGLTIFIVLVSLIVITGCGKDDKDLTPPEIKSYNLEFTDTEYTKEDLINDVTAYDDVDGDVTDDITYTVYDDSEREVTNLESLSAGEYLIKYQVSDEAENKTSVWRPLTITEVQDTDIPMIMDAIDIKIYATSSKLSTLDIESLLLTDVEATDESDGNLTDQIEVAVMSNSGIVINDYGDLQDGDYKIVYSVSDEDDNETTVEKTLTIDLITE